MEIKAYYKEKVIEDNKPPVKYFAFLWTNEHGFNVGVYFRVADGTKIQSERALPLMLQKEIEQEYEPTDFLNMLDHIGRLSQWQQTIIFKVLTIQTNQFK